MVLNSEDWTTRMIRTMGQKERELNEKDMRIRELEEKIKDKDKIIDALRDLRVQK